MSNSTTSSFPPEALVAATLYALAHDPDDNAAQQAAALDCGQWNAIKDQLRQARQAGGLQAAQAALRALMAADRGLVALMAQHTPQNGQVVDPFGGEPPILDDPLSPFPLSAFPNALRDFALAIAQSLEVPVEAAGMLTLAAVSGALTGKVEFVDNPTGWRELCVIYTMAVMEPSRLKSSLLRRVFAPIYDWEGGRIASAKATIERAEAEAAVLEAEESALRKALTKNPTDQQTRRRLADVRHKLHELRNLSIPRFLLDDVTPERLGSILAKEARAIVASAEDSFPANLAGRYSNGQANVALFNKAWSGERHAIDRMGRTEVIERPALTVALAIQDAAIGRHFSNTAVAEGQGVLPRFLPVVPDPMPIASANSLPPPVPVATELAYRNVMSTLLEAQQYEAPILVHADDEALRLLRRFRLAMASRAQPGGDLYSVRGWAGKAHGHAVRVAVLFLASEQPQAFVNSQVTTVRADLVQRATVVLEALVPHVLRLYRIARHGATLGATDALIRWVARRGNAEFTIRDLQRAMPGVYPTAASAERALALLEERNLVAKRVVQPAGRGRPKTVYVINPLVAQRKQATV